MKRWAVAVLLCTLVCLPFACTEEPPENCCRNAGFEEDKAGWSGTFALDKEVKHSGAASARFDNAEEQDESIVSQTIALNQSAAIPLVVSGWSKAENATGRKNHNYSLWCDVEYVNDTRPGKVDEGHQVPFDTGTHDWQYVESIFNPKHPVKRIRFHALFRRSHAGTVWFDDLTLRPLSSGPLAGTVEDVPKAKADDPAVRIFRERLPAASPNEALVSVRTAPAEQGKGRDTFRCFLGDEFRTDLPRSGARGVFWKLPLQYPPGGSRIHPPAPFVRLHLLRLWEKQQMIVETAGKQGGRVAWHILLPEDVAISGMELQGWEARNDKVSLRALDGRLLLSLVTDVADDADRCLVSLRSTAEEAAVADRKAPEIRPLTTQDGLKIGLGTDGGIWSVALG